MKRIDVIANPNGYALFKIEGDNVLGYQAINGTYHLIHREKPSFSTRDADAACAELMRTLREAGGDVGEMSCRSQLPVLLPLGGERR